MPVKKVSVAEVGVVHLYKRRGTRSLRLSISHSGEIRVSMPPWVPYRLGIEFVLKKKDWLKTKQKRPVLLESGQRIGRLHQLIFSHVSSQNVIRTRIHKNNEIHVTLPLETLSSSPAAQAAAQKACVRALKNEAEAFLPGRLRYLAEQHGLSYHSVTIKRLSSRWGSCSEHNDIVLNCYLIQLPNEFIDYVIMHELLHTKVMAHGLPFWSELAHVVPNLTQIRKEIRKYQPVILPS